MVICPEEKVWSTRTQFIYNNLLKINLIFNFYLTPTKLVRQVVQSFWAIKPPLV